jgi:hypothetical protein
MADEYRLVITRKGNQEFLSEEDFSTELSYNGKPIIDSLPQESILSSEYNRRVARSFRDAIREIGLMAMAFLSHNRENDRLEAKISAGRI